MSTDRPSRTASAVSRSTTSPGAEAAVSRSSIVRIVVLVAACAIVLQRAEVAGYHTVAVAGLAVVWAALWTVAAVGAGCWIERWLRGRAGDPDRLVAAVAGAAVLVASAALLSTVGWFRPGALLAVTGVWVVVGVVVLLRDPPRWPVVAGSWTPLIGVAGIAFLVATTVSPFYDQWHQHLGFPWIWLGEGSIHALPSNWYTYMPVNSSLLFAYGLKTLGPWSAQIIHWWCGLLTALCIARIARRFGSASAYAWSLWIIATTPTILHLSTTAGSDLVLTIFAAGAWMSLLETTADGARAMKWWVFTGVCVGLAVGTKYTAIGTVGIPLAVGAIALHRPWAGRSEARGFFAGSTVSAVVSLVLVAPWLLRNFMAVGNPFFPFANRLFAATLKVPLDLATWYSQKLSGFDLSLGYVARGLDLGTFLPPLDGFPAIGLLYLPLFVLAAFCWRRFRRPETDSLVAGTLAGIGFWLVTLHVDRYLVPVLVAAIPVLATALGETMRQAPRRVRGGLAALIGLAVAWNLATAVSRMGIDRLGATLGVVPLKPVLEKWVSSSPAFEPVAELPDDARILLVAEARALGFQRPVEIEDPYGTPQLQKLARRSTDELAMARELADRGITHVLANPWEARRMGDLAGREGYFVFRDAGTAERLIAFTNRCMSLTWSERGVRLYRLDPECRAAGLGDDLASW